MRGLHLVVFFGFHLQYTGINGYGNESAANCESADSFQCQDGTCILSNLTCNNNADCKNGEDESVSLCGCLPNEFACAQNDTCIALIRRCDRTSDCPDNEDEENCDTYMCPESHVKCKDHFCIQKELVCNFHKDCSDGSDEVGCSYRDCWAGEFRCNNGECIPPGFVCDGFVDCLDSSDETYCLEDTCADGRRIHESYRCNGWPDCETTHLDELLDCPPCNYSQHTCQNGRCIAQSHTCDGVCDCLDSCDDESACDGFYSQLNGFVVCAVGASFSCSYTVRGQKMERCVAAKYLCDGVHDCPTGRNVSSDEYGCDGYVPPENRLSIFHCDEPDGRFLPLGVLCDQNPDCLLAEDELHCSYNSTYPDVFICKNGQKIPQSRLCDLHPDCWDKSDETNCLNFPCSERIFIQDDREIEFAMRSCRSGQCIRRDYWCDFIKDCADGSDEDSCPPPSAKCGPGEFRCRTLGQCVPSKLRCFDNRDPRAGCADHSHLEGCQDVICPPGMFKCRNGPCINESLLCNGQIDCPDVWTDEHNCTYACHGGCSCRDSTLNCSGLGLAEFPENLQDPFNKIYFADNLLKDGITSKMFDALRGVLELDLTNNSIKHLPPGVFRSLSELRILSLRNNVLWAIKNGTFDGLSLLTHLQLGGNNLMSIETRGFYGLSSLTTLSLRAQQLSNISRGAFVGLSNLNKLDLSQNKLEYLSDGIFIGLSQIKNLDISENPLVGIDPNAFRSVLTLNHLVFDEFRFCCSARRVRKCLPTPDEFSSCEDLMSNFVLRICVWLLGVCATFGNLLVIVWRIRYQHSNRVHSFLITNLAMGDLFMGIYLMMIAVVDSRYRGEYSVHDKEWRTSRLCGLAGFLSTFSSELSVFTLTVITLDRFLAIIFPFKFSRLEMNQTVWVMLVVWIVAVVISGLPLADIEYFKDFYGRSGVCLALHITPDKPNGWEYSVFVFLILNLISFSIIAFGYITMYGAAKTTSLAVGRKLESRRAEAAMARRMTLIVATDAACWVPIILLGVLSLSGITVPKQVFAWVAVFVLPLNAAVNPVLYTISTAAFLDPASHNLRHLNRSLRVSADNRSRRTYSTNLGASSFRRSFLKFQRHLGSSFHCHDQQWSTDNNHFELNAMGAIYQQESGERGLRPGLNLSHVEEDDSDYESESFNERPDLKPSKGEPVIMVRRQSLPKKKWMRSSDSESTEEQYCTKSDKRKRFFLSRSEGSDPITERERTKWLGGRKKKKKKLHSELYD